MLRKFAAALLATALIAGPALAASPSGTNGAPPAAPAAVNTVAPAGNTGAVTKPAVKPVKMVKHLRKHLARHHRAGKIKLARHFKSTKTVRHHIARHIVNPAKGGKNGKVS